MNKGKLYRISTTCLMLVVLTSFMVRSYGCSEKRSIDPVVAQSAGESNCITCHGSHITGSVAPPRSVNGEQDPTSISVGAHAAHLSMTTYRTEPIQCSECHIVPLTAADPGHDDSMLPAELTWGPLTTAGNMTPVWDRENARCLNTYCHSGGSHTDGSNMDPSWTYADTEGVKCGSCHASPPADHSYKVPDINDCGHCHTETAGDDRELLLENGTHIDGVIQAPSGCGQCHPGGRH